MVPQHALGDRRARVAEDATAAATFTALVERLAARPATDTPATDASRAVLAEVGLAAQAGAMPRTLSGGQRQRAALARTLMEDRPVVLLDEPFSAVDLPTRLRLQDLAARLLAGRTVLMVTHDPLEALRLAHRVFVLSGRPAHLAEAAVPPAPPPRRPQDPVLLAEQGELLAMLKEAAG